MMLRKRTPFVLLLTSLCISSAEATVLLSEGFEDVDGLSSEGWVETNNSDPIGLTGWFQGNTAVFDAQSGPTDSYAAANFENTDFLAGGDISNWLITPTLSIADGDVLSFYTRTTETLFPDRLEVRMGTSGASADVGTTATSVGDFGAVLLTVNPGLDVGGYPTDWALFQLTIFGVGSPTTGRYAFRYFVPDTLVNANYIGIDTLLVERDVPEPSLTLLLALGLGALSSVRRSGCPRGRGLRR